MFSLMRLFYKGYTLYIIYIHYFGMPKSMQQFLRTTFCSPFKW